MLKDGELQQFGTPAEIYNRPANLFVADFMGSPAMNLLDATVAKGRRHCVDVTRGDGGRISARRCRARHGALTAEGKKVVLGIRPEAVTDRDGADRNSRAIEIVEAMSRWSSRPAPTPSW